MSLCTAERRGGCDQSVELLPVDPDQGAQIQIFASYVRPWGLLLSDSVTYNTFAADTVGAL